VSEQQRRSARVWRRRVSLVTAAIALASLAAFACEKPNSDDADEGATVLHFDTARVRLVRGTDTLHLVTELATKPEQRALGLMERHHLPDSAGMLFVYPTMQSDSSAFWMFRTRIPLDIAFIDSGGTVRSIRHMVPCPTTLAQGCPTYPAGARFLAALEVNAGYFDRHGVRIGDRVVLSDSSSRPGRATGQ
jgi:uncharacterized protein